MCTFKPTTELYLYMLFSEQVFNCLQPLTLCLTHSGSLKLVDRHSEDYDMKLQFRSDELLEWLKVNVYVIVIATCIFYNYYNYNSLIFSM